MSCNAIEWHRRLSPSLEKIDVLSRLSPCLESDKELALMQSVLLSIIRDYIQQARNTLNALVAAEGEEQS